MRQVSSSRFFIQAFIILFSTELMMGMFNPSYVQLFFDQTSPFYVLTDQHAIYYGFFMMLSQLAGLIANLLWGAVSDRYGRKVAIAFAYFGVLLMSLAVVMGAANQWLMFFICGYALGQFFYAIQPVMTGAVTQHTYASPNKVVWVGRLQFVFGFAFVVGPYIGSYLMMHSQLGFLAPFYVAIPLSIIAIILSSFYRESQPKCHDESQLSWWAHFKNPLLLWLVVFLLLNQLAWGTFFQFLQPIAKLQMSFSVEQIGLLVSLIGLSLMVSALLVLPFLRRFLSLVQTLLLGVILMLIGIIGIEWIAHYAIEMKGLFSIMVAVVACGDMLIFSVLTVCFSNAIDIKAQGTIAGLIYTLGKGVSWAVAGVVGGYLMFYGVTTTVYLAIVALLILFFLTVAMRTKIR